jgi:hypothetical protein
MPDKPAWFGRLDEITAELNSLPHSWVDRPMVEAVFGVGRRRAQQILAACGGDRAGSSAVVDKNRLIACLQTQKSAAWYEQRRQRRFARNFAKWKREWEKRPRVLVEGSPDLMAHADLGNLPDGVELAAGEIRVRFETVTECLEKLLALGMAIGNDMDGFGQRTGMT